ncbi:hypothetical protein [Aliivibrio fischeri]
MDGSALCALAFRLAADSASPYFVSNEICEEYVKDISWGDELTQSSGGIKKVNLMSNWLLMDFFLVVM